MRRMNLDHAQAEAKNLLDIGHDVGSVPRVQTSAGEQAFGIVLRVIGDELIDGGGEADHLRRNIIDEHGAVDSAAVEVLQKRLRGAAIVGDLIEVVPLCRDQCERLRLEEFYGLDMDMTVGDDKQCGRWSIVFGR